MNAFAGIRAKGGRNPTPLAAVFPGVCSGVICFPVGVQPPQPPANFYPAVAILFCMSLAVIFVLFDKRIINYS